MADDESPKADKSKAKLSPAAPGQERPFGELRHYVPADILNVSFPSSVRGYEPRAVDAHLKRVNRVIAELKVSASSRGSSPSEGFAEMPANRVAILSSL